MEAVISSSDRNISSRNNKDSAVNSGPAAYENLPGPELTSDYPRPPVSSFVRAAETSVPDLELARRTTAFAEQEKAEISAVLQAVFSIFLHRYSGEEDIVFGSVRMGYGPDGGSRIAESDSGELRISFEADTDVAGVLRHVKQTIADAAEQKESEAPMPACRMMLILYDASVSPDNEPEQLRDYRTRCDLSVIVSEQKDGLRLTFDYDAELFAGETVQRFLKNFIVLLSGMTEDSGRKISALPLLTEEERHQVLAEWNRTAVEYPRDTCIHQLFEEQAGKNPDATAVIFEGQKLTCRELNRHANQLAHYLRHRGVETGTPVGISLEPSPQLIVSLLGVLKAGGVYVPLDPNYPQDRLDFLVEDSGVRTILTTERLGSRISSRQVSLIRFDRDSAALEKQCSENPGFPAQADGLAYIIYTSGSTGKPKAVLGTMRGVLNRLHWMWDMLPFAADEVCCQKTSINFVDHVAEIFLPLLKGVPLVVVPEELRSDVFGLTGLMRIQNISRIVLVPSLLKAMLDHIDPDLTPFRELRYVFCSGEALPLSLARDFFRKIDSARLFNLYGSSEVAADVTCFEVNIWEIRSRILHYFNSELMENVAAKPSAGACRKPFTTPEVNADKLAEKFRRTRLPRQPVPVDEYYRNLSKEVLPYTIDTGAPAFIGHMTSALPYFLHDMSKMISKLNQNLVKIETSKSLIFIEREALALLHRLFYGFSEEFYEENIQRKNYNLGIITTGGTTANISALLCARNAGLLRKEDTWELSRASLYETMQKEGYEDIVLIGSRLMHYSFNKAVSILGLGTDNIIFIDNDTSGRLNLDLLEEKIAECRKNKLYILAIIGIAGTTETGQIDPLPEMAAIARKAGVYFHADAAWGGATIFSEKHKDLLNGIEQADSITLCGHKQLYLPQGISLCLFRDPQMLSLTATSARYQAQQDTFDTGRFTIEGSRSGLSLCLHAALHIIGKRGYEFLINDSMERAKFFSGLIDRLEPFELIVKPVLNIVNYRYIPPDLRKKARIGTLSTEENRRISQLNAQIQKEQFEQGRTFVSQTTLTDTVYGKDTNLLVFRTVLANPNTTVEDLYNVLDDHLKIAGQIEPGCSEQLDDFRVRPNSSFRRNTGEAAEKNLKKNTVPIGKPIANTEIYILDKYLNPLPLGAVGELYVGGANLAEGYLHQPDLTGEKFIAHPFADNRAEKSSEKIGERLFRTGDLARRLPDGNLEFRGRIDHQIKLRGFRIELGEIEAALARHETVDEAVVVVRERGENQLLAAYMTEAVDSRIETAVLRAWLRQQLPDYMVPAGYTVLESLPLTPNGKVDRRALPEPEQTSREQDSYTAPAEPLEQQLCLIWEKFLNVHPVGVHDNFFDLGGNSLLAVGVFAEIGKKFSKQLPVPLLLKAPTVKQLAQVLKEEGGGQPGTSSLVQIQPGGSMPSFFYVPPIGSTALSAVPYARYLDKEQPVYGLQPLGFEKGETPHDRVEEMAAYYISEIRSVQPQGPYYLAGHCYGCTIVFEMAQQLYAHGFTVALLALIDQSSPLRAAVPAPLLTRMNAYTRRLLYEYNADNLTWAFLMESFYRRFSFIRHVREVRQEIDPHEQRIKQVMDAHFGAVMSYIPQPYPGKITLLQNSKSYEMEQVGVLTRRWCDLAQGGFDRRVIEGTHWNIFAEEPRFRQLAEELRNCLEGAQASHETTL